MGRTPFGLTAGVLVLASLASVVAGAMIGPLDIPAARVLSILLQGGGEATERLVVLDIRLSRIVLSWLAGAGLGLAGAVFQGLLRNPLADPFTLGVSTGAALGASLAIYTGLAGATLAGLGLIPAAAVAGALGALLLVLYLGGSSRGMRRDRLVLAGIVTATTLSAFIALVKSLDEEAVGAIVFWIMGSFQGRGWPEVWLLLPGLAAGAGACLFLARELDILGTGDAQAATLGVDVSRVRLWLLVGGSLITGFCVAVSGVIGFVGLVVPHLVRMLQGPEHRRLLVTSGLLGGVLLLWSDVAARVVLSGGRELPVGVVTAMAGGPFFCLLLKTRGETR
jgi:iron complex transport system permease protein